MLELAKDKKVKISSDIELKDRLVGIQRVVKVTKGGRAFGFSAIVVEFWLNDLRFETRE